MTFLEQEITLVNCQLHSPGFDYMPAIAGHLLQGLGKDKGRGMPGA